MAYLIDRKATIGSYVIPVTGTNQVNVFSEFAVSPINADIQFGVFTNGDIQLGYTAPGSNNNIIINSGIDFNFSQVTGTDTTYLLTQNDYAIEIISDTYNTVLLPSALGIGGRTYIISRGSNNPNLVVRTQNGENIDTRQEIQLRRKNDHIKVMANNIDSYYVI